MSFCHTYCLSQSSSSLIVRSLYSGISNRHGSFEERSLPECEARGREAHDLFMRCWLKLSHPKLLNILGFVFRLALYLMSRQEILCNCGSDCIIDPWALRRGISALLTLNLCDFCVLLRIISDCCPTVVFISFTMS